MVSVAQTVVLDLETSEKKNKKIQKTINEFQEMSKFTSDLIVSFDETDWSTMNPQFYRRVKEEFDDRYVASAVALEAIEDVVGGYKSWRSNGKVGEEPEFGNNNYVRCKSNQITIEENNRGYGIKLNIVPYKPEWFHINTNSFSSKYIEKIIDEDASFGTCEIHKKEDGLKAHLVVTWEVDVLEKDEVETVVGVDIGENVIYSSVAMDDSSILSVNMEDGNEFRHYRERLKKKRKEMMEKNDLRGVKECRGEHERYTEQILHTNSKKIIEEAKSHISPMIVLEDLTNYRKTAANAIHDWPFAQFQKMIMYKAKAAGIPVEIIDPRNTSKTCRNCGHVHSSNRNGHQFKCRECEYEVHADVNAAMNIAFRGSEFNREKYEVSRELPVSSDEIPASSEESHDSLFAY